MDLAAASRVVHNESGESGSVFFCENQFGGSDAFDLVPQRKHGCYRESRGWEEVS